PASCPGPEGAGDGCAGAAVTGPAVTAAMPAPAAWAGPAPQGDTITPTPRAPASPVARSVRSHGVTSVTPSR
ncbi:2-oxoglutarate dehydrogenase, E2 component, dihydrolipoamide succinyltransferase, partial [Streptomyces ardesiacus]